MSDPEYAFPVRAGSDELRYLPCELHCHSQHSDGHWTVSELLRAGAGEGLSLLALTDHNTFSGIAELTPALQAETIPAIPGIEWTTDYGHLLVLAAARDVDWRTANLRNVDEKLAEIRSAGGLCGIAHPFRPGDPICCGCTFEFEVGRFDLVDFIEVWSGPFPPARSECRRALAWWSGLLDRGYHIAATHGRDWHGRSPGAGGALQACTYLGFSNGIPTVAGALDALRGGRTVVSLGPLATFVLERDADGAVARIGDRVDWSGVRAPALSCTVTVSGGWPKPEGGSGHGADMPSGGESDMRAESVVILGRGGRVVWESALEKDAGTGVPASAAGRFSTDSPYLRLELRGTCAGTLRTLALSSPVWIGKP